jgi:hypothetical protein
MVSDLAVRRSDSEAGLTSAPHEVERGVCHRGALSRSGGIDRDLETCRIHVRSEVFTAVTMKNVVFWDVTQCGSCKNRRFGGT